MAGEQGAARGTVAALRERLAAELSGPAADAGQASQDLFGLVHLLEREHLVRRTLADGTLAEDRRAGLLHGLISGRIGDAAANVAETAVRARWTSSRGLQNALEGLAVEAEVIEADRRGQADDFEDELFRFGRIVEGDPGLRAALADEALPVNRKQQVVESLLESKVTPSALRLVVEAVTSPVRARSVQATLERYLQVAADHGRRLIAHVRSAVPLTDAEQDRLAAALRQQYGQEIRLNTEVDPSVVGGLSVVVGSELIDGTIARRIDEARRQLS